MQNEFDDRPAARSLEGGMVRVQCRCGWEGLTMALLPTETKNKACPTCGAEFKRLRSPQGEKHE